MANKALFDQFFNIKAYQKLTYHLDRIEEHPRSKDELMKLRTHLANCLDYDVAYFLPDRLVIELGETLQCLYIERDSWSEFSQLTCAYLNKQIVDHRVKTEQLRKQYAINNAHFIKYLNPSIEQQLQHMDDLYERWQYTDGYYHYRQLMQHMLLKNIRKVEREGTNV